MRSFQWRFREARRLHTIPEPAVGFQGMSVIFPGKIIFFFFFCFLEIDEFALQFSARVEFDSSTLELQKVDRGLKNLVNR